MSAQGFLTHPLLDEVGVAHGFALRGTPMPDDLLRPKQVHGTRVVRAEACRAAPPPEADAVVSDAAGTTVGVVTADCVPILLASQDGRAVAAVHAGWRGLAAGVVAQGVDALRHLCRNVGLRAVVGPRIGICCYEVDAPVLDALAARFTSLAGAVRPVDSGHALLDLGQLVARELRSEGLREGDVACLEGVCTRCDAERFHSYRRDGPRAGRLWHFVRPAPSAQGRGASLEVETGRR